jgi:hypothetical protein
MKIFAILNMIFISTSLWASIGQEEFISGKISGSFDKEWVTVILQDRSKAKVKRSVLEKFEVKIKQDEPFFLVEIARPEDIQR